MPKGKESVRLKSLREKRQYYRHETDLISAFRIKETTDFTPARIVNISVVGAYLKSERQLISGKQIELSFQLPGKSKRAINCMARVMWSAKFKGYHCGLEFINLKRFDRYRIAGFIRGALRKKGFRNTVRI